MFGLQHILRRVVDHPICLLQRLLKKLSKMEMDHHLVFEVTFFPKFLVLSDMVVQEELQVVFLLQSLEYFHNKNCVITKWMKSCEIRFSDTSNHRVMIYQVRHLLTHRLQLLRHMLILSQELKLVFPNAQQMNCGGKVISENIETSWCTRWFDYKTPCFWSNNLFITTKWLHSIIVSYRFEN